MTEDQDGAIRSCQFKCRTKLRYEEETDSWRELITNIYHDNDRCKQIKEKRRQDVRNKNTRFRPWNIKAIKEIRKIHVPLKAKKDQEMVIIMNNMEEKPTKYEYVAAIYPDQVFITEEGRIMATSEGLQRIANTLHRIRKNPLNYAIVPFSIRDRETGNWFYSNIPNEEEFQPVKDRLIGNRDGIDETLEKAEAIVKQTPKERKEQQQRFEEYLSGQRTNNNNDDDDKKESDN